MLVVDETRRTGGVSEGVIAALVDAGFGGPDRAGRERGQLHPARRGGEPVLLYETTIEKAAVGLLHAS